MKNNITYTFCVLLFLSACGKKDNTLYFTKDSYPLKVGNWWRYRIETANGADISDTFTMTIVSMTTVGATKDFRCQMVKTSGVFMDSGHFLQSDTSLYYSGYNPSYSYFGYFNLTFPFKDGQRWPGILPHDTINEDGILSSYKVYDLSYTNVFVLDRRVVIPEYNLIQIMSLAPNVGLIYQSITIRSDTAAWRTDNIYLLDYKIN